MPLSDFLLDMAEQKRRDLRLHNRWMIQIRWIYLFLLGTVAIVATSALSDDKTTVVYYGLIAGIGVLINGLLWLATLPKNNQIVYYQSIATIQILLDLCLASAVVYLQDGLASRATVLYMLPVLTTGVLFRGNFATYSAFLSAITYGATLFLYQHYNQAAYSLIEALVPALFYASVFIVAAVIIKKYTNINTAEDKERSYNELLAMLRHQLRHPTSVIATGLEVLEKGSGSEKLSRDQKHLLSQIGHENNRLNNMISNLLTFSDPETSAQSRETINLIRLIDTVALEVAMANGRSNSLKVDFPLEHINVRVNSHQFALAIENIVENACIYSPRNSNIYVNINTKNHSAVVTVTDEGEGLSEKEFEKLMSRIDRPEKEVKRTNKHSLGIGLYVSRVIIERFGGKLEVKPNKKGGTTATITLPLSNKGDNNEQ